MVTTRKMPKLSPLAKRALVLAMASPSAEAGLPGAQPTLQDMMRKINEHFARHRPPKRLTRPPVVPPPGPTIAHPGGRSANKRMNELITARDLMLIRQDRHRRKSW
jgi:hypothetical protein